MGLLIPALIVCLWRLGTVSAQTNGASSTGTVVAPTDVTASGISSTSPSVTSASFSVATFLGDFDPSQPGIETLLVTFGPDGQPVSDSPVSDVSTGPVSVVSTASSTASEGSTSSTTSSAIPESSTSSFSTTISASGDSRITSAPSVGTTSPTADISAGPTNSGNGTLSGHPYLPPNTPLSLAPNNTINGTVCPVSCNLTDQIAPAFIMSWQKLSITATQTYGTLVYVIDQFNHTSTSTKVDVATNISLPTNTNEAGTIITVLSHFDPAAGRTVKQTVAYPSLGTDYGTDVGWAGRLPTATSGSNICQSAPSGTRQPLPSHPFLPVVTGRAVDPNDTRGWGYFAVLRDDYDYKLLPSLFPSFAPLQSCYPPRNQAAPVQVANGVQFALATSTSRIVRAGPVPPPPSPPPPPPVARPPPPPDPQPPAPAPINPAPVPAPQPPPAQPPANPPAQSAPSQPQPPAPSVPGNGNPLPPAAPQPAQPPAAPAPQSQPIGSVPNPAPQNPAPGSPPSPNNPAPIPNPAPQPPQLPAQPAAPGPQVPGAQAPAAPNGGLGVTPPVPAVGGTGSSGQGGNGGGGLPAAAPAPIVIGGVPIAPTQQPVFVAPGVTAVPGGPAVNVGNTPLSIAPSGNFVVIGGTTQTFPAGIPASIVAGGQTLAQQRGPPAFVIGSQTIGPGAPAVVVGSNTVSLAANAQSAFVNGQVQQLAAPAPTSGLLLGQQAVSSNRDGSFNLPNGAVAVPGQPGVVFAGSLISISPDRSTAFINGVPQNVNPSTGVRQFAISGSTFTANNDGSFAIGSQTLRPGGSAITQGANTISLAANGANVQINGQTIPVTASTTSQLTLGSSVLSARPDGSFILPDGQQVRPGSAPVTFNGQIISVSPDSRTAVVNGKQQLLSAPTAAAELTVGDQVIRKSPDGAFTLGDGQVIRKGQVATISGTRVSFDSNGGFAVVGSSTEFFGAAATAGPITGSGILATAGTDGRYTISGQVLSEGGFITMNGHTISLAPGGSSAVFDGTTEVLKSVPASVASGPITAPGISATTGADGKYTVSGSVLSAGGSIVVNGHTISLSNDGAKAIIDGTVTETLKSVSASATPRETGGTNAAGTNYAGSSSGGSQERVGWVTSLLGILASLLLI